MKSNNLLKILCCIPTILVSLYFIPFLGVCLIILRCFVYHGNKHVDISYTLIGIGGMIFIPKIVAFGFDLFNIDYISYLETVVNSDIYFKLMDFGKFILVLGIILIIISFLFKSLIHKSINAMKSYILMHEKQEAEISRENDMAIKLKQEKAKNTNVIYCPKCGASNLLTEKVGICKYCRSKIENKNLR